MNKSAYIRARVEPDLKIQAEAVFQKLGLNTSQVLNLFYKQVCRNQSVPLDLHLPNAETVKAIEEARQETDTVSCQDADDMFKKLGI